VAANVCAHEAMVVESLWLLGAEHVCVVPGYFLMLREASVSQRECAHVIGILKWLRVIQDLLRCIRGVSARM